MRLQVDATCVAHDQPCAQHATISDTDFTLSTDADHLCSTCESSVLALYFPAASRKNFALFCKQLMHCRHVAGLYWKDGTTTGLSYPQARMQMGTCTCLKIERRACVRTGGPVLAPERSGGGLAVGANGAGALRPVHRGRSPPLHRLAQVGLARQTHATCSEITQLLPPRTVQVAKACRC